MRRRSPLLPLVVIALVLAACSSSTSSGTTGSTASDPDAVAYVFTYFTGEGGQGIRVAVSTDGRRFTDVNRGREVLRSTVGEGLTRDPSVVLGPDQRWHMVWSSGALRTVGIASSDDLIHWDEPRPINVMAHEPTAQNSWAPEITWDRSSQRYEVVFASTVRRLHPAGSSEPAPDGTGFEHRLYVTHSTDLRRWSKAELLWDSDVNAIDATVVRDEPNDRWIMAYKAEALTPKVRKRIAISTAPSFDGPWDPGTDVAALGPWVEGPSLVRDLSGDGWMIVADRYYGARYAGAVSKDLRQWTPLGDQLEMPPGARHGTVLRVPLAAVRSLLATRVDPSSTTTTSPPPRPTPTTSPPAPVDPSTFGTERPTGLVTGVMFDLLITQGISAQQAVCTTSVLTSRISEGDLITAGIVDLDPDALAPVKRAALDCGIPRARLDKALVAAGVGG